jgi:hypothetical protein
MWKTVRFERKLLPRQSSTFSALRRGISRPGTYRFRIFRKNCWNPVAKTAISNATKAGISWRIMTNRTRFFLPNFLFSNSSL